MKWILRIYKVNNNTQRGNTILIFGDILFFIYSSLLNSKRNFYRINCIR